MKRPWYRFLYVRSPLAKIGFGILAVLVTIVVLLFQGVIEQPRMLAQTGNWDGRSIEKGAEIYANNCAPCHGIDGKGAPGVAPALNSKYFFTQRLKDLDYAGSLKDYVKLTVAAGRPSIKKSQWAQMMPTWGSRYGGPLRDDQVENVTNFVLNWQATAETQGTPDNPDPWIAVRERALQGHLRNGDSRDGRRRTNRPAAAAGALHQHGLHRLSQHQRTADRYGEGSRGAEYGQSVRDGRHTGCRAG